jgi:hypothetical protein
MDIGSYDGGFETASPSTPQLEARGQTEARRRRLELDDEFER